MKFLMSMDKALEIAKTIPTVTMRLLFNQQKMNQTLFLTDEQAVRHKTTIRPQKVFWVTHSRSQEKEDVPILTHPLAVLFFREP